MYSPRVKILSIHALHSLACYTPDVLHEEKVKMEIVNRLSDGNESVVRAALKVCLSLAKVSIALETLDLHLSKSFSSRMAF